MPFELTILGSNSALPSSERLSTAQVLNVLGRFFLIDCAEGTQIQLRKFKIKFGKINHIFISHLHGDHYFGLMGLLSTFNLLERTNPLNIYGTATLMDIINFQLECMEQTLEYDIIFKNLKYRNVNLLYEDDKITVKSFPLKHRIPTCGFLFQEKQKLRGIKKEMIEKLQIPIHKMQEIKEGEDFITENGQRYKNTEITNPPLKSRSYAFVSDTKYTERIIPVISEVDLLYHEATFRNDYAKVAKQRWHATNIEAANIAEKAKVKKLILGHFSARYKNLNELLDEAKTIFKNTELADDGKVFSIKNNE